MQSPLPRLCVRVNTVYRAAICKRLATATASSTATPQNSHVTQEAFQESLQKQRMFKRDAETGVKPTGMQRHFLILTRLFDRRKDIPEYVGTQTMARMTNRMRVVFIFAGIAIFYTFFLSFEKAMAMKVTLDKRIVKDVNLTERNRKATD